MIRIACMIAALSLSTISRSETLATVDDYVVTEQSYKDAVKALGRQGEMVQLNPEMRKRFLEHLINSRLIALEAKKQKFDENPEMKQRFEDLKMQVLANEYADTYAKKKMSEGDLKKYFEKNKDLFSKKEIHAQHILLADETKAKEVLKEAQANPQKFEELGKQHSKDKSVDLGFFGHGRMVPEFESAAFATSKGKIHDSLVKTQFGFHIIKVLEVRGDEKARFEDVKEEVQARMKTDIQKQLVENLRKNAKIVIKENALK